ncbi:MAG: TonB C-terminal domain-containing protein [Gemmatimonadales bacterium]
MKFRRVVEWPRQGVMIGVLGTATVHVAVVATALLIGGTQSAWRPTVYAVELVAAPLPSSRPPSAAPAKAPTATPPPVAPKPKPAATKPLPAPKAPAKVDPKVEPTKPVAATNAPAPGETPGAGTDVANVKTEGTPFPYPDYLRHLTNEILRRWSRPLGAASLEAEVSFTIHRDGRISDIQVARSSRSYSFDLGARGAVEQAGEDRAFGALPQGWQSDILKVAFLFTPRSR